METSTMKKSHLSLCFFLFSIYTNSLLSSGADEFAPVLDVDGNELQAGTNYYILPVVRGRGGGLTLESTGNKSCPLSVVQAPLEVQNGLPLAFRPVTSSTGVVRASTDQNIKFSASTVCVESTVWKLDRDESIGQYVVTTGGVEGNPGRETVSNWFKIVPVERDYKLLFCPTVCDICRVVCQHVGIFLQDGKRRLVLTAGDPFKIMFKKA